VGTDGFGAATLEDRNVDIGRNMENTNDSLMPSYCRRFAAIGMVVAFISLFVHLNAELGGYRGERRCRS
jgi:hypothetical protein